jgi:hypothetical protein
MAFALRMVLAVLILILATVIREGLAILRCLQMNIKK